MRIVLALSWLTRWVPAIPQWLAGSPVGYSSPVGDGSPVGEWWYRMLVGCHGNTQLKTNVCVVLYMY